LVPALNDAGRSLTVSNSASSHLTLMAMGIIALIGVPIVLAYTALVYRSFRGRISSETTDGYEQA
jgi:cytochrome d ubiquinol oxidase subunit II